MPTAVALGKKAPCKQKNHILCKKGKKSKTKQLQPLEKRFVNVASTKTVAAFGKKVCNRVFENSRNYLKKRCCFSLGHGNPLKKREPLEKRRLPPLGCRPAGRPLVYITRWPRKKGIVGKGHGSHLKSFKGFNPPKNFWGSWGLFHFLGVYPPDGCVYNITKTNGNIYGENRNSFSLVNMVPKG